MMNVARTTVAPDRQWDRRSDTAGRGMLAMVVLLFIDRAKFSNLCWNHDLWTPVSRQHGGAFGLGGSDPGDG
jgi:hypothetical protein